VEEKNDRRTPDMTAFGRNDIEMSAAKKKETLLILPNCDSLKVVRGIAEKTSEVVKVLSFQDVQPFYNEFQSEATTSLLGPTYNPYNTTFRRSLDDLIERRESYSMICA